MTRKVKFGVHEFRDNPSRHKVTVTHVGIYMNYADGSYERGVLYHTFNEPNYITQAMPEKDFLETFRFVGKLFSIHKVEEQIVK